MSNCFDCNGTGTDKDFGGECHCGATVRSASPALTPAENEVGALADWLGTQTWSSFAQSLSQQYVTKGYLSEKQIASAKSMREKCEAKAAEKAAAAKPVAPAAKPATVKVPSGHYALTVEGVVKYYRVNSPTDGRWAGYTFVDAQGSDDYYKLGRENSAKVVAEIAKDIPAAMKLYGLTIGRCGHCNRTLTDEDSRAAGIGPICARKMGW